MSGSTKAQFVFAWINAINSIIFGIIKNYSCLLIINKIKKIVEN